MYTFPGLWPFIERAAEGRTLYQLGRARELWHSKQVQDALGQLPRLDPESRKALLAHVVQVRDSLAAVVEGVDLAIAEAAKATDTPLEPRRKRDR
ncbi:hypothetical protein [Paludisphaera borealis]|uniref:Uncharacterized protein n=1 Tax=Paludisphaera borealis TaxID=1387353 RepID=A0A1U7CJZ6_9BACT|nr:hypothetical protein [Paludisphaera borealis]APW59228.1 hypothetical protein BSF38_00643 [Paludisphaera borealis]